MKTMTELVSWFQMEYPELVDSMKKCTHHRTEFDDYKISGDFVCTSDNPTNLNPYHIESDVFTHTMMVCKQAENAPYTVRIAALLHDIGKPDTRAVNAKNGRVSFFNHDAVGAFKALEILKRKELGLSKEEIIRIFNLIALHTQIYKLSIKQLSDIENRELLSDLIKLGNADHRGRFHTEGSAEIPYLSTIPFKPLDASVVHPPNKEVIVLCGLPASGKSSYVNELEDHYIVSRDGAVLGLAMMQDCKPYTEEDYNDIWKRIDQKKVDRVLQERFSVVKDKEKVVVDMTHMSKKSRKRSLSHFGPEYKKKCVVFLTDLETLHLRNSERTGKVIDKSVIERMMRSFYPPTLEEFDEIEYVILNM